MNHASSQNAAPLPGFLAMTLPEDATPPPSRAAPSRADKGAVDLGALTRAVRAGDAAAFARFYDMYGFRIHKQLLLLSRGDEAVAREVFQTVAIKLARKLEVFDDEPRLLAWLQRVARNAFIDHARAHRRSFRHLPFDETSIAADAGERPGVMLKEALHRALEDCEPADRELLSAFYVDGRPLAELAVQSGQTYKALESRLARLRQKLRRLLLTNLRHEEKI